MRTLAYRVAVALALCCTMTPLAHAQTSTFDVTYDGFTPEAQAAFEQAVANWSNILVSNVPIKVNAHFTQLLPGMLGITLPNGRKDFAGAPLEQTWYATSLANSIAGQELNPDESDMDVYLNSSESWFFGLSGPVPAGQYDMVSVAMHEMGHGCGFVSLAKKEGSVGSFGLLEHADFFGIPIDFIWPDLDTLPSVLDRFLVRNTGARLDTFPNPSAALGTVLTGNAVYFDGGHAKAANNGNRPRMYASAQFQLGSSISHFNESTFPTGNPNEMMTPNGEPGTANHQPGPIALGVLKDIGWNLNPALAVREIESNDLTIYPNPVSDRLFITASGIDNSTIRVTDCTGKTITQREHYNVNEGIDLSRFAPGSYIVQLEYNGTRLRGLAVKQ